jgi:hypothetical protein
MAGFVGRASFATGWRLLPQHLRFGRERAPDGALVSAFARWEGLPLRSKARASHGNRAPPSTPQQSRWRRPGESRICRRVGPIFCKWLDKSLSKSAFTPGNIPHFEAGFMQFCALRHAPHVCPEGNRDDSILQGGGFPDKVFTAF